MITFNRVSPFFALSGLFASASMLSASTVEEVDQHSGSAMVADEPLATETTEAVTPDYFATIRDRTWPPEARACSTPLTTSFEVGRRSEINLTTTHSHYIGAGSSLTVRQFYGTDENNLIECSRVVRNPAWSGVITGSASCTFIAEPNETYIVQARTEKNNAVDCRRMRITADFANGDYVRMVSQTSGFSTVQLLRRKNIVFEGQARAILGPGGWASGQIRISGHDQPRCADVGPIRNTTSNHLTNVPIPAMRCNRFLDPEVVYTVFQETPNGNGTGRTLGLWVADNRGTD